MKALNTKLNMAQESLKLERVCLLDKLYHDIITNTFDGMAYKDISFTDGKIKVVLYSETYRQLKSVCSSIGTLLELSDCENYNLDLIAKVTDYLIDFKENRKVV